MLFTAAIFQNGSCESHVIFSNSNDKGKDSTFVKYMYSAFHKLGYISSGSKGSIIEPLDLHLNWIERASSGHRAGIKRRGCVHRADTMRHRAGEIVRPSSTLLENSISTSCFLPIKKEHPQESRSGTCTLYMYVVEGVLKAKPQTRHQAWLMCNERTLIEHASSEQKKEIERRPSCDRTEIERRPSGDRAETERRLSGDRAEMEHPWYQLRAAQYVTYM